MNRLFIKIKTAYFLYPGIFEEVIFKCSDYVIKTRQRCDALQSNKDDTLLLSEPAFL